MRTTVFNGRIDIEKINEPFLYKLKGVDPSGFPPGRSAESVDAALTRRPDCPDARDERLSVS